MPTTEFEQFNGTIGPSNLLSLVRNTAPFYYQEPMRSLAPAVGPNARLIEMGDHPYGFLAILHHTERLTPTSNPGTADREDYFALCMACHHGTVATFIPTDVDSKIRGVLWGQREDPEARRRMLDFTLQAMRWDISKISTRATELSGVGPVSGHNGEMLGVLAGALGCFLKNGDAEYAEKAADAIETELRREASEYRHVMEMHGHELDLLRLSSSLTHNVGDLDQGISFWSNQPVYAPYKERFHRLAHENSSPFDGTFHIAAHLYKKIMSSEGHRHYPLREVRALRQTTDFLLPLGPFFDGWGERVGGHPKLTLEEKAEVLAGLLAGCKKIAGQVGYFRAVSGLARGIGGQLEAVTKRMPAALRHELKEPEVQRHVAMKQISFESGMRKRALAALAEVWRK